MSEQDILVTIISYKSPDWDNKEINQQVKLNLKQLYGIVAIATAIFNDNLDNLFAIYDQDGTKLNLDTLLEQSNSIVLEGEIVLDLQPEYDQYGEEISWMDVIAETSKKNKIKKKITKSYTVKAAGYDGYYLIQFEMDGFYEGMISLINMLGLDPKDVLVYLHLANFPIEIPV